MLFLFLQLEDNWEQEKKIRAEVEKARRKAESDLKMTIDNLNEMERSKLDLEEVVKKYACAVIHFIRNNVSTFCVVAGAGHRAEGFKCINAHPQHRLCAGHGAQYRGYREGRVDAAHPQGAPSFTQGQLGAREEAGTKQCSLPSRQGVLAETCRLDFQRSQGVEGVFYITAAVTMGDKWSGKKLEAERQPAGYCHSPGVNLN